MVLQHGQNAWQLTAAQQPCHAHRGLQSSLGKLESTPWVWEALQMTLFMEKQTASMYKYVYILQQRVHF